MDENLLEEAHYFHVMAEFAELIRKDRQQIQHDFWKYHNAEFLEFMSPVTYDNYT